MDRSGGTEPGSAEVVEMKKLPWRHGDTEKKTKKEMSRRHQEDVKQSRIVMASCRNQNRLPGVLLNGRLEHRKPWFGHRCLFRKAGHASSPCSFENGKSRKSAPAQRSNMGKAKYR
jgi:hypothetical protein